ncbi:MAG TPA: GNAT family N-acetyltransferase [Solirubrobacterales bacterium]
MGAGVQIREATESDAVQVAELWTEAYVTLSVGGRSESYRAADFFASARAGEVLVVDAEEGIAGAVVLLGPEAPQRAEAREGEAEIARLAVAATARRGGIGRALVEFCEQRARAAGWRSIALWSRPGQVEAHRLYESLGYRRVPERDSTDATGHRRLVFRRELELGAEQGLPESRPGPDRT